MSKASDDRAGKRGKREARNRCAFVNENGALSQEECSMRAERERSITVRKYPGRFFLISASIRSLKCFNSEIENGSTRLNCRHLRDDAKVSRCFLYVNIVVDYILDFCLAVSFLLLFHGTVRHI
jgi:hypothetical protein